MKIVLNNIHHIIKRLLSGKTISVLIVLLAIIARFFQLLFFFNIRVDRMFQVQAMQNFTNGHGFSLATVLPNDLSATIYEPLIKWPPGYSLLVSPFYYLFNQNSLIAGFFFDMLVAIALIIFSRLILKILDTPMYLINIFTLLTAFFIYHFYLISCSDAIAITFFIMAVYFTLVLLKKNQLSAKTLVALILSLFLSGFIKYQYIPIIFIIPAFLFLKGYCDKNASIRKAGVISFLCLAFLFIFLFIYQKYTAGSAVYISETTRGFFPENLLSAWPANPASIIKPDTIGLVLPGKEKTIFRIFQFIHFILLGGAFILLLRHIRKARFKRLSGTDSFFYLTFFLTAGISILLMILSLRVAKEETFPGISWTYAEEPRYYGLINILLQIAVFQLYQYYRQKHSKFIRYLFISLIVLMLPETFRGIIFSARRVININKEEYSWQYDRSIQQYADAIIQKEKTKNPDETKIVTGASYYIYNRVSIYSHLPVLRDVKEINNLALMNTKKPVLLLIILQENDLLNYQPFLSSKEKELAGYFRGFYFYTTHVNPH